MQIAITSQNRRTVTQHAGKCRNFWIYEVTEQSNEAAQRRLVELPLEASFHATQGALPAALADVDVLISASIGGQLRQRLLEHGIVPVVTEESDIDIAISRFLSKGVRTSGGCGRHQGKHREGHGHHREAEAPDAGCEHGKERGGHGRHGGHGHCTH